MSNHDIDHLIPSGMKPWYGERKGPPEDWDVDRSILRRGTHEPYLDSLSSDKSHHWEWNHEMQDLDILGYYTLKE